jgi:TrkA domain protein
MYFCAILIINVVLYIMKIIICFILRNYVLAFVFHTTSHFTNKEVYLLSFFTESDLPGIGKKISCTTHSKERAVIVVHHDGKRELYIMDQKGEPKAGIAMLDEEARRIGSFLSGIMYKPKAIEDLETALHGISIDWFKLDNTSPIIGKPLGVLGIRKRTQVSIIAIVNNDDFIPSPSSEYIFREGDTCVVIGNPENFNIFLELIREL